MHRPAEGEQQQSRRITEFAVIDGHRVDGSGAEMQTYRGGMSIPAAWRCAILISDLLGSVPWNVLRENDGEVETLDPTPWLLHQPAPPNNRMTTFSSWALDLMWHGNAVGVISDRNRNGTPTAVLPIPAQQVHVRTVPPTKFDPLRSGKLQYEIGGKRFDREDIVHIMGPCAPGAVRGFGVLEAHMRQDGVLHLAQELEKQAASIGRHGVPTGKLKVTDPDATEEDLKDVKENWESNQKRRSVAVLNATTEFEPLSWNPDEMQLVEARKFSLHEVALIFGVPLSFVGADQATRTYSNLEQESMDLLRYSLRGYLARFEQELTAQLPPAHWARADLNDLLRPDMLTRYQAYEIGLNNEFLTTDEVRRDESRGPMEDPRRKPTPAAPEDDDEA